MNTGIQDAYNLAWKFALVCQGAGQFGLLDSYDAERRPVAENLLAGTAKAMLIATACSDPPQGRNAWTMQLLADSLVTLELVESISDETVRTTLKKTKLSRG